MRDFETLHFHHANTYFSYTFLEKVGNEEDLVLKNGWQQIMTDMYGDQDERKLEIIDVALADKNISQKAKDWLVKQRWLFLLLLQI